MLKLENGCKIIKIHLLLVFNGESLPRNNVPVIAICDNIRLWWGLYEICGDTEHVAIVSALFCSLG